VLPYHDELSITANGAEVRRASEWLESVCLRREVPPAMVERLLLSLNEVLANVIGHGGANALSSPVGLRLEVVVDANGGKASVTVSDQGIAVNPLSVSEKPLPKTLAEAAPGGHGLVMIRRFSDWLDYRHEQDRNHLTFGTRWKAQ
jgi:anti-sigma regulatory factor (Ser/Thr protein kinase)